MIEKFIILYFRWTETEIQIGEEASIEGRESAISKQQVKAGVVIEKLWNLFTVK